MTASQNADLLGMKGDLGELRGQMREISNSVNAMSQKLDAIALSAASHQHMPDEMEKIKERIAALEAAEHGRKGAISLGSTVMKSPLIGWLAAIGAIIYNRLKG